MVKNINSDENLKLAKKKVVRKKLVEKRVKEEVQPQEKEEGMSIREERIRKITNFFYSRPDIRDAIYEFCKHREISARYFEGFGSRPDAFVYPNDVVSLAGKGSTSFHCSEEIWSDPLSIKTGMDEARANELRIGWDLVIDIDCKWIEYSKYAALAIIETMKQHGIENVGTKFSGSKGFHILLPWKSFPKVVRGMETKDLFPDLPRKLIAYVRYYAGKVMREILPSDVYKEFRDIEINKGFQCHRCGELAKEFKTVQIECKSCGISETRHIKAEDDIKKCKCNSCRKDLEGEVVRTFLKCDSCNINSIQSPNDFATEKHVDLFALMGLDLALVSPRHLFRVPYSLHEKTSLVSCVLTVPELKKFSLPDAHHLKVKARNFMPDVAEDEAKELLIQALDWDTKRGKVQTEKAVTSGKYKDYKPIEIKEFKDSTLPPCAVNMMKGLKDGRKRALFALINMFRSVGMTNVELEARIKLWNSRNPTPLKFGYIKSQLEWAYRNKPIMPPNCKEHYEGIGVCKPGKFCSFVKNPASFIIKKSFKAGLVTGGGFEGEGEWTPGKGVKKKVVSGVDEGWSGGKVKKNHAGTFKKFVKKKRVGKKKAVKKRGHFGKNGQVGKMEV